MPAAKVVLITGASSGIGLATAIATAKSGFTTVATLRDPDGADALRTAGTDAGVEFDVRLLDVTSPASVAACVESVIADHARLDAVVNNAGAGYIGTIENDSMDQVRQVMEVNFFGVVEVTKAALPYLRATKGRVITVTSVGGVIGQPFNEAYCAAKFAAEGFMESLAPVAAVVGVTVCVVEPGAVASEFVANTKADPPALVAAAGSYADAMQAYIGHALGQFGSAQTPAQAAEQILAALTDPQPAFRIQTSDWARKFASVKITDLDGREVQQLTSKWIAAK